jgi:acetyl esterase/lipase
MIGWVIGAIGKDESWIRRAIAATGCVVVDVNYRLAPEYRFPIPIEDAWAALVYVSQHGATLGVDTSRISLGGWSAGGHLSAVLSHRARDTGLQGIVFVLMATPVVDASALGTDLQVHEGLLDAVSRTSRVAHCRFRTRYPAQILDRLSRLPFSITCAYVLVLQILPPPSHHVSGTSQPTGLSTTRGKFQGTPSDSSLPCRY